MVGRDLNTLTFHLYMSAVKVSDNEHVIFLI